MELRDYQKEICGKAVDVLQRAGWCYLAMEVRTGKTLTSLAIAEQLKAQNVLVYNQEESHQFYRGR